MYFYDLSLSFTKEKKSKLPQSLTFWTLRLFFFVGNVITSYEKELFFFNRVCEVYKLMREQCGIWNSWIVVYVNEDFFLFVNEKLWEWIVGCCGMLWVVVGLKSINFIKKFSEQLFSIRSSFCDSKFNW